MYSQLNSKGIHHIQDYDKSGVFSLGLVTLSLIYEVFKSKINSPEFKNQLSPEDLQELILEIDFDLLYNREAGSVDSEYLSIILFFIIFIFIKKRKCDIEFRKFQYIPRSDRSIKMDVREKSISETFKL